MKKNKGFDYSFVQQIPVGVQYAVVPFLPTHPEVGVSTTEVEKSLYLQLSHLSSQPGAFAQADFCQH